MLAFGPHAKPLHVPWLRVDRLISKLILQHAYCGGVDFIEPNAAGSTDVLIWIRWWTFMTVWKETQEFRVTELAIFNWNARDKPRKEKHFKDKYI